MVTRGGASMVSGAAGVPPVLPAREAEVEAQIARDAQLAAQLAASERARAERHERRAAAAAAAAAVADGSDGGDGGGGGRGGGGGGGGGGGDDDDGIVIQDPVWGAFSPPRGQQFKPWQLVCLTSCPCCLPPCCDGRRRAGWRRMASTASCQLGILQAALWLASLCFRGFAPVAINPMLGSWPDTLNTLQAKNAAEIVSHKQLWRLVTPAFLHAGLVHLLMNLLMQLRVGVAVELEWGTSRYLQVYFGAAVFSTVFSAAIMPNSLSVGASGALMGVMGAWITHLLVHWGDGDLQTQARRGVQFLIIVLNVMVVVAFSFVPFVDWAAHLFGLLGGLLLGGWLFGAPKLWPHTFSRPCARRLCGAAAADTAEATLAATTVYLADAAARPPTAAAPVGTPAYGAASTARWLAGVGGGAPGATSAPAGATAARRPPAPPPPTGVSRRTLMLTTVGGLVAYLVIMLAGLLGLFYNTSPAAWLLHYCSAMAAAYPSYDLSC